MKRNPCLGRIRRSFRSIPRCDPCRLPRPHSPLGNAQKYPRKQFKSQVAQLRFAIQGECKTGSGGDSVRGSARASTQKRESSWSGNELCVYTEVQTAGRCLCCVSATDARSNSTNSLQNSCAELLFFGAESLSSRCPWLPCSARLRYTQRVKVEGESSNSPPTYLSTCKPVQKKA